MKEVIEDKQNNINLQSKVLWTHLEDTQNIDLDKEANLVINLWSEVLWTYLEDAQNTALDKEDNPVVDYATLLRHASNSYTRSICHMLDIRHDTFIARIKAIRSKALGEWQRQDNLQYAQELLREIV